MPPATTAGFRLFLKSSPNMKLSSDSAVLRVLYEGLTSFALFADFDDDSIKTMAKNCKETIPAVAEDIAAGIAAENEVPGVVVSTQSIVRLQLACKAVKYYISVSRTPTAPMLHYDNILTTFKIEYDAYEKLQKEDPPKVPVVSDSDNDRKIIKWAPAFVDCMSRTFGIKGPLAYILRDEVNVQNEAADPLLGNDYFGVSGSIQAELISRLEHGDSLYRSDNKTVYLAIAQAVRGTSVESTVKSFNRTQDGRGAYFALIDHHAGESKYRSIMKKRNNLLSNIKWNGQAYSLEKHVSNHRQAVEDLNDCANHITVSIPDPSQRVEFLIDSITCADPTLQAAIGLIRSNVNGMRSNFELAANSLIEVDPFSRSRRQRERPNAQISAIDFSAGRGPKTGVDLRWHSPPEFKALSKEQKDELISWQKTDEGKATLNKSKAEKDKSGKRKDNPSNSTYEKEVHNKRKKWLGNYVKKASGLKHVMSVLAKEEAGNSAFVATLNSVAPPASQPAPTPGAVMQQPTNPSVGASSVVIPPAPAVSPLPNPPAQGANTSALSRAFPGSATRMTLNSILKPSGKKGGE